jgi:NAD-reducing hydrogenase large subunit
VREPLTVEKRDRIAQGLPQAMATTREALDLCAGALERMVEERRFYGNFPSLYLGLVGPDGGLEHYDGTLRLADADGSLLEDGFSPARYSEIIAESQENWSYLKFPYYRPRGAGTDGGMYRVGALARLNVSQHVGTPRADEELGRYRRLGEGGGPVQESLCYHQARLIELLFCLEAMEILLDDRGIMDRRVCSFARVNHRTGIGVIEAPRGVLIHDYRVNEHGLLTSVNLIVATGHNNRAMNRTILQIARHSLKGGKLDEGLLNRVEHGIRCYDPCLSCSTHVAGRMPVSMDLYGPGGELLDSIVEGAGRTLG